MTLKFVMSDLHGGYDQLIQILEHINALYPTQDKQFIFLGDYVDRGPKTRELLDHLMSMDDGHNIFLRGNHDDMAIGLGINYVQNGFLNGFYNWMGNGGDKTLESYGYKFNREDHYQSQAQLENALKAAAYAFPQKHIDWLKKHPYYHKDDHRTYVHAGFYRTHPGTASPWPIEEQRYHTLTWIREEFLNDQREVGGYVVHGHTPTIFYGDNSPRVDVASNRCNVDSGAVYGGVLSAAIFDDTQIKPIASINHTGQHVRYTATESNRGKTVLAY